MKAIELFTFKRIVVTKTGEVLNVGQWYDDEHEVIIFFASDYFTSVGIESTDATDVSEYIMKMGGLDDNA